MAEGKTKKRQTVRDIISTYYVQPALLHACSLPLCSLSRYILLSCSQEIYLSVYIAKSQELLAN